MGIAMRISMHEGGGQHLFESVQVGPATTLTSVPMIRCDFESAQKVKCCATNKRVSKPSLALRTWILRPHSLLLLVGEVADPEQAVNERNDPRLEFAFEEPTFALSLTDSPDHYFRPPKYPNHHVDNDPSPN